jgi:hypothetical protein
LHAALLHAALLHAALHAAPLHAAPLHAALLHAAPTVAIRSARPTPFTALCKNCLTACCTHSPLRSGGAYLGADGYGRGSAAVQSGGGTGPVLRWWEALVSGLLWPTVRTVLGGSQVRSRVQYVAGVLEVLAPGYSEYSRWGSPSTRTARHAGPQPRAVRRADRPCRSAHRRPQPAMDAEADGLPQVLCEYCVSGLWLRSPPTGPW